LDQRERQRERERENGIGSTITPEKLEEYSTLCIFIALITHSSWKRVWGLEREWFIKTAGEVPRGEKMLNSGTDPESYITEYTLVYEDYTTVHRGVYSTFCIFIASTPRSSWGTGVPR
jgi:hypothetical protein